MMAKEGGKVARAFLPVIADRQECPSSLGQSTAGRGALPATATRGAAVLASPSGGRASPRAADAASTVFFNDQLGITLAAFDSSDTLTRTHLTAYGEDNSPSRLETRNSQLETFFTSKPHVAGLGHAFLLRNYRADLGITSGGIDVLGSGGTISLSSPGTQVSNEYAVWLSLTIKE